MKKIATSHTAFFRLFFLCLLLIAGVNLLWGDNVTYSSITTSTSLTNGQISLSSSTFSLSSGYYGHGNSSGGSLTITANSGYTISGVVITFETEKTDRTGGGSSASVSSATHYSYSISSKTGTISLKDGGIAQQTVTFTSVNKCRITAMTVTYASSATPRTFKSGQVIYFKDTWKAQGNGSTWKISDGNICAKFEGDGTAWYNCSGSDNVSGSWNAENTIYRITVPGSEKEFTSVTFTRGTNTSSDDGVWNRTTKETPEIGRNMFCVKNTTSDSNYEGWWEKYAPNPALIGDFNNWDPDQGGLTDGRLIVDLEASTDYKFKVLVGETWWGLNDGSITNTTSSWYLFYSGQGNCTVTSGEAGEYCFHWNNSTHYLGVFYPQARLAKQKYIYFDARSESNWKESDFAARFYFKYYDSGTDQSNSWCAKANALEDWVYYTTVPNDDYVGQVQMNRYSAVDGTYWNTASIIHAYNRTSSKQNCMVAPSSGWDNITLTWGTYCPPISSSTLSDNSTSVISWTNGDGTSGNPYLVPADGTIKVSASATKAVNDDNMTINYDFKVGGSSAQSGTGSTFDKGSLTNNTTYTISLDTWNSYNSTSGTKNTSATALYYKALTTYSVTHTKSNVTTSDRSGAAAAAYYLPYSATFTASTGYNLPGTITVKFGSTTKTSGTDYTWNSSTGVVSIPASKIDGDVTITVTGVAKTTTLTFDPNTANHGTSGDGGATATYGSSILASITHTTPASGYVLEGYYTTATDSPTEGEKIINADGSLVKNTTYTTNDATPTWKSELSELTLYARYEEIPDYTFSPTETSGSLSAGDTVLTSSGGTMIFTPGTYTTTLTYTSNGLQFGKAGSGGVFVELNKVMQVGTRIVTTFYVGSDSERGLKLATAEDNVKATYAETTIGTYTETYTVTEDDGLDGTNVFKILRNNTAFLKSLHVYNCGGFARRITYHTASEDYSLIVEDGSDIGDTHIPSGCAAADRVFVGWATSEVSTQQTAPTIVSTDGKLDDVSSNMDLYAVFASRNGGKVTGSHKLAEDFESYTATASYNKSGLTFDNSNGLLWQIDYGNVTTTGASRFSANTKNVLLSINNSPTNKLITRSAVKDVLGISVLAGRETGKIYGVMYWGSTILDMEDEDNQKILDIASAKGSYKTTHTFSTPQNIYVRFSSLPATTLSASGDHLYLDSVVFTIADRAYYLTDYSTTCTKAASATVTWVGGEGAEYDEPSAPALGDWVTFPEITRPNYQFDGWKATIEGDEKSHTYNAGESFLVNHDVTFTAQWTRYIEDIDGVSPITTGNGIAVRSYEIDSIVVNSETATTPTANKVGTDASMFTVTIDAVNKRVADGKTHFPYYITYTPSSHNITSSVDISFTCDGVESSAITVQGRSLPEEFVIAVKKGDGTWVALPNTIVDNSKAITPIEIAVDNTTTPTEATFAPNNTVYKTDTRYAVGANVYGIRFTDGVLKESKYNHLQVSSSSGTNYVWLSYTGSSTCQDWLLQSEDMSVYKLKVPTSGAGDKKIGLYSSNIGYYSSPSNSDIYLLPIENKAEQYEATVTTWSQSHIEVTLTEALEYDADEVIAKLAETSYGATAITGGGTQYGLTFEGIDLAGKNGQKLLLTWKKNGSVIGWSTISIPRIVAQSAEQDTWSKINPKASDIVVLNYPATVGTLKGVAKEVVLADGGQLVISANKALVVSGKITREDGSPTTAADLVIKSTSSGNGTLIFENDGNEATVEMYSKASAAAKPWSWQYMAVPFTSTNPLSSYYGSYMYEWPSDCSTWQPVTRNTTLTAFTGYLISNPSANYTYSMEGELAPTEDDVVIDVPAGKEMVVGNSWTGPIQITQMTTEDFSKVTATIYLFNTGMDSEEQGAATPDEGDRYAPGTYVTIPINEAEDVGVTKISSLQGFYVEQNKTEYAGQNGSLTLSYSKHVRPTGANTVDNGPMHAPKRVNAEERPTLLKIKVSGSRYDDRLILLEREDFSTGFDNGWDGKKLDEQGAQPMLYTTRPDGTPDAVSAIPEMDGTVISFHPGEDNTYTLRFEYDESADELYIVDTQTTPMQTTRVLSGNTYTFNTSNNDTPARFLLTRNNAPQITTANESPSLQGRSGEALKLILNQQLYIYRNGILYDATGRRVDSFSVGSGFDANANANAEQEKGGAE